VAELDEGEGREHASDEAAEMAADRDVRDRERQREVEHDERHRLARERPGRDVLEHEQRSHDPEDRPGRPDRHCERAREQQCPRGAREPRDEVHEEEPPRAERLLDDRPEPVEREHVERDVQHARVEEHRGDEAVPLAVHVDRRADQRPVLEDLAAGRVETCALGDRDEVDEDVHRD